MTLQRVRQRFESTVGDDIPQRIQNPIARELNHALYHQSPDFKLIHPLFIGKYSRIMNHHRDSLIPVVGLDVETEYKTGHPMLLGFQYENSYHSIHRPDLEKFHRVISNLINNAPGTNLVTWGNLDLQIVIRLFDPDPTEQNFISKGYAGSFDRHSGEWFAHPPLIRVMSDGSEFFIDHYISNRSLRIGIRNEGRAHSIWIFNISQFFPARIAQTAKTLGMEWLDFPEDTHLIDWERFEIDEEFRRNCFESNKQDARIVRDLARHLGELFNTIFGAYPSLYVSTGSLADAAVSKWLSEDDYASNSWRWLSYHNYELRIDQETVRKAETLLSEAFSAGYVDQFALGYFPEIHTADISSAYPHKIRHLPDLRHCVLYAGTGDPQAEIGRLQYEGMYVFTAVIRGEVTIPESLKFHPITIRTEKRQNIRPSGKFRAAYYLEERQFCIKHGAKFADEEYVIFALKRELLAPIANVSTRLKRLREEFIVKMDTSETEAERIVNDGMQFLIKVVDNSLYGKTVMTTPIVEDIEDKPQITGFKSGDRFNMLYGGIITSRTRIQLADACMQITANGGTPILAMTDSIFWFGDKSAMPTSLTRHDKTAGYFEEPETLHDFYLLKTGQYEYRHQVKGRWKWEHKMRGLNLPYDRRSDTESFYRKTLSEFCSNITEYTHPQDIEIPLPTRRLVTIGAYDIERLGLVEDSISNLKPFVMSGKQTQRFVFNWKDCLDGYIMLKSPVVVNGDSPLAYLRELYEHGGDYLSRYERKQLFYYECVLRIMQRGDPTEFDKCFLEKRLTQYNFKELEEWFGVTRSEIGVK